MPIILGQDPNEAYDVIPWRSIRVARAEDGGWSRAMEYPSVIAGTFASEFTDVLPDEVLTTTLIHHQHYFPVEGEDGRLKPAFLAVINTDPDNDPTAPPLLQPLRVP